MKYIELTYWQVAVAASLIVLNAIISFAMRLRLEKMLAVAALRTVVQLLLVGMVLQWIFDWERWYVVIGIAIAMTLIAGSASARRSERRYPGIFLNAIVSVWVSSWFVTAFALFAVLRGMEHWYQPQYAIPLLGMVLGNTLNGISIGLNSFTEALVVRRGEVESLLALGATRYEAARGLMQSSIRSGLIPILNSMMLVGIVSLPGMMTGQLISGMPPVEAVKYQIVIMFLIAGATILGTFGIVYLSYRRLFNEHHQFRSDLIQ
jgi:putative ABC transport system permease protein